MFPFPLNKDDAADQPNNEDNSPRFFESTSTIVINNGLSQRPSQTEFASFGDGRYTLNHKYDPFLRNFYQSLQFNDDCNVTHNSHTFTIKELNPNPQDEHTTYNKFDINGQYAMDQHNILLCSRLFIDNLIHFDLANKIPKNPNILDIGCGLVPTLGGIKALWSGEYLGVDIRSRAMEAKKIYQNIPNTNFLQGDALTLINDSKYQNSFDLVLIQHPNLISSSKDEKNSVHNIFLNVDKVIKPGGFLYVTLTSPEEARYFEFEIQPILPPYIQVNILIQTMCNITSKSHSEKYIYLSKPKPFKAELKNYIAPEPQKCELVNSRFNKSR